jgi:hypothetical protein
MPPCRAPPEALTVGTYGPPSRPVLSAG